MTKKSKSPIDLSILFQKKTQNLQLQRDVERVRSQILGFYLNEEHVDADQIEMRQEELLQKLQMPSPASFDFACFAYDSKTVIPYKILQTELNENYQSTLFVTSDQRLRAARHLRQFQ